MENSSLLPNELGGSDSDYGSEIEIEFEVAERWMTIVAGLSMIFISATGIVSNLILLRRFIFDIAIMNGFYLMCSSKTISNLITLLIYFIYNGPVALLNTNYGPEQVNEVLNQIVAYGIYAQGPMAQLLIAANRFIVILLPWYTRKKNGKSLTLVALIFCWSISLFTTISGFPAGCLTHFDYEILTWNYTEDCVEVLAANVMYLIILLSILSTILNFLIAGKLVVLASKTHLDSTATRRRKQMARRLFIQNCFQDFVYIIDTFNGMYFYALASNFLFQFSFTMLSNLCVPTVDGLIMLFFNHDNKRKSSMILTPRKKEWTDATTN